MKGGIVFIVWGVFIVLMYFMIVYPQRKADKKKKAMLNSIHIGDEIITIGGIHGRVTTVREKDFSIQLIDDKARMKVERWAVKEITKHIEERKHVEEKRRIGRLEKVNKNEAAENSENNESAE